MPRSLSTTFRSNIEDPHADDPAVVFLTFSHDDWADDYRFCWDTKDFVLDGETYLGFPFALELLTDSEDAPSGRLAVQNVDRMIGEAVRDLTDSPTLQIDVYAASDWDLTADPRTPLGTPTLQYSAANLYLREVSVDVAAVEAFLRSWDFVREPWPSKRATQTDLSGLYR